MGIALTGLPSTQVNVASAIRKNALMIIFNASSEKPWVRIASSVLAY